MKPYPSQKGEVSNLPKNYTLEELDKLYLSKESPLEKVVDMTEVYRKNLKPISYTSPQNSTITIKQLEAIASYQGAE